MAIQQLKAFIAALFTKKSDPQQVRRLLVPSFTAGVHVDHDTALTSSAVFRAVAYISQSVAGLPWDVIRESPEKTMPVPSHSMARLLKSSPNSEMSAFAWRETMLAWALTWGNGYSEIELDEAGRPVALWPISPDRVEVKRLPDTGGLVYEVSNYQGGATYLPSERVFHLHGLGFDGLVGYSVISLAARSIGLSLAAERYAEDFFANGTVSTGALKHPKTLSEQAHKHLRESWEENNSRFGKKWRPLILEEGTEWQTLSIPPEDAQLLETQKFSVNVIARWFGLPPHKLADLERSTNNNIEHQSIEVVNDCLMPWVHRLEQEADRKMFTGRERGIRTKINVRGLMRGDDKSRAEYYQIMRRIGVYSTNDIRRLEDMNPVGAEGDELIVESNMTTLKRMREGEPQPAKTTTPKPQPEPQQAMLPVFEAIFDRIIRREKGQFEQVSAKLGGDEAQLAEWADNFIAKHRAYVQKALAPAIASLEVLAGGEASSETKDAVLQDHLTTTRTRIAYGFDLAGADRAHEAALRTIEAIVLSALGGNGHGQIES